MHGWGKRCLIPRHPKIVRAARRLPLSVIPANAGIQWLSERRWIPAFAGMTGGDGRDVQTNGWSSDGDGWVKKRAPSSVMWRQSSSRMPNSP